MSDDWDVDSYRTDFENEEHWQLKRSFMLAHKDKFPEDELVCLAQVFTNIEFMGCRYPEKTMTRVANLAKGVVEKYREQRRNSLKRTFVTASDAASAKVKGQICRGEEPVTQEKTKKMIKTEKNSNEYEETIVQEKQIINTTNESDTFGGVRTYIVNQEEWELKIKAKMKLKEGGFSGESTSNLKKPILKSGGPLGDFVLILGSADEHPVSIIQRNSLLNKCKVSWEFEEVIGGTFKCKLFLNNVYIATSTGVNMKMSKEHTAMVAIAKLREFYYGIRVKTRYFSDTTISPAHLGSTSRTAPSTQLGEDNIGRKLMQLMGWQGGGLGSRGQGREEPVGTALHVRRDGLGLSKNMSNFFDFKKRAKEFVVAWMNGNSDQDLVFSSDFSVEERKILHEIASNLSLKSKSYGKDSYRQLVISRKCDPWEILKELLRTGGNSDKYELLYPTGI